MNVGPGLQCRILNIDNTGHMVLRKVGGDDDAQGGNSIWFLAQKPAPILAQKPARSGIWKGYMHKLPILDILGCFPGHFYCCSSVPNSIGQKRPEKKPQKWPENGPNLLNRPSQDWEHEMDVMPQRKPTMRRGGAAARRKSIFDTGEDDGAEARTHF